MKITDIRFKKASFRFKEPVHVAFGIIEGYETVIIRMDTDQGITGYGEAGPLGFVTGDSLDTCLTIAEDFKTEFIGEDPLAIERIHQIMDARYNYNTSVKAAFDIACYDIAAKNAGLPLYRYLGGFDPQIESDMTISMDEPQKMADDCLGWIKKGFRILKLKLGDDIVKDMERVRTVRNAIGKDIVLRIDANQGWTAKEAIAIEPVLRENNIELIEQPVKAKDYTGLKEVKDKCILPVVADESIHVPEDAALLAGMRACDGFNIKLMKCGGIFPALKINAVAEANHMMTMIGCMGESIIANTAGMHLAAARRNISKIDLDVTFMTSCDWITGGFTAEGGCITLTEEPGIGIHIDQFQEA